MDSLPPTTIARLVVGLGENSRIKRKLSGLKVSPDTFLLATILDRVNTLLWFQTKDGQKNRNRPESIAEKFIEKEEKQTNVQGFTSIDEFEKAMAKFNK